MLLDNLQDAACTPSTSSSQTWFLATSLPISRHFTIFIVPLPSKILPVSWQLKSQHTHRKCRTKAFYTSFILWAVGSHAEKIYIIKWWKGLNPVTSFPTLHTNIALRSSSVLVCRPLTASVALGLFTADTEAPLTPHAIHEKASTSTPLTKDIVIFAFRWALSWPQNLRKTSRSS